MKKKLIAAAVVALATTGIAMAQNSNFNYNVDRFADIEVLRYQVPGFNDLSLQQKKYVYYLTEAALQGRDILFDQNGKYNLVVRQVLEAMYTNYKGDRSSADFKGLEKYLKQVWFGNGIHHHYAQDKFVRSLMPSTRSCHLRHSPFSRATSAARRRNATRPTNCSPL